MDAPGLDRKTPNDQVSAAMNSTDNIDEDLLFNAAASDAQIARLTYDVYSIRASDRDIYRKISTLIHNMAGMTIPGFVVHVLQVYHADVEKDEDKARRLYFDVDNKVLKNLQSMHRALICDRVKGFDVKLAKVMMVVFQQYQDAVKDLPEMVLDRLLPKWPEEMHSLPAEKWAKLSAAWKSNFLNTVDEKPIPGPAVELISAESSKLIVMDTTHALDEVPPNYLSASTMASSVCQQQSGRADSKLSTCSRGQQKTTPAVEYGLTFDILVTEPQIFSIFMNPKMDYTTERKDPPIDPDYNPADKKESGSASQIWKQLKRMSTRVTRSLRGNPQYYVTAQEEAQN